MPYTPTGFNPGSLAGNGSSLNLDQVNQAFRQSPVYQQWMQAHGKPLNGLVKLTDSERNGLGKTLENNGFQLPDGWEIDQGGNIHEESHTGRNLLIGAAIAAAAFGIPAVLAAAPEAATGAGLGGVEAGAASGVGSAVASGSLAGGAGAGLGGAATAAGVGAGANAAFDAAGNFIGSSTINGISSASAGLSGADILKYGVPLAGQVIGGVLQSKAAGNASDAQQKYLEEALAYQKEQDALNRARQTGLDQLAKYQDARNFAYTSGVDSRNYQTNQEHYRNNVGTEAGRYGDFSNNIAPFVASGSAANARAAKLLGLDTTAFQTAPRSGSRDFTPSFTNFASYGPQGPQGTSVPVDAATKAAIAAALKQANSSDTQAGWENYLSQSGDSASKNWDYWAKRIATGEGVGKGYQGATEPTVTPAPPMPRAGGDPTQQTPAPTNAPMITIQAPNGATKQVPADQAAHWQTVGAKILQGVAA